MEPRMTEFGKDEMFSRNLLAKEKDDFLKRQIGSFWKSSFTIVSTGAMTITMSVLGHKLFAELVDFCNQFGLTITESTLRGEIFIVKIVFYIGAVFVLKGIWNILNDK